MEGIYHFSTISRIKTLLMAVCIALLIPLGNANAQRRITGAQLLQNKVTVEFSNTDVATALTSLEVKTGVEIVFTDAQVRNLPAITRVFNNITLARALDICLEGSKLTYSVVNNSVVIKTAGVLERVTVFGRILDENKQPLAGVNVLLVGTRLGVNSDANGDYSIEFGKEQNKNGTLRFQFVGMEAQEFQISGSTQINLTMESDNAIEEVVVNGFYEQKRSTFTGASTSIKGEDLLSVSPTNLIESITTLTPGMVMVENNAQGSNPNAVPSLLIRGASSLITNESEEGVNNPLIILDGVEISMTELYDLDIFDIERVDVLKDASATILYGEQGANGVIVIERKKVEGNKAQLTYNFVPSFSVPDLSSFNLTSASQKLELERLAGLYDDADGSMERAYYYKLENVRKGVDTEWIKAPLRVPFSHTHSLALSARGENLDYRATASFTDSYGVMKDDNRRKYSLGFSINYHIQDKLTIAFKTNYSLTDSEDSPYGSFSDYTQLNPYEPIYDENGDYITTYYFNPYDTSSDKMYNPLYNATLSSFSESRSQNLTNSLSARWNLTKDLFITGQGSVKLGTNSADSYTSPDAAEYLNYTDVSKRGEYRFYDNSSNSYSGNIVANYGKTLDDKGSMVRFSAGSNVSYSHSTSSTGYGVGFLKDELNDLSFAMGYPEGGSPSATDNLSTSVGFFANANISYHDKYFADLSYRASGSSRFGSDNSFAPFWAAGIGWHLHNEDFIKDVPWINSLTLRYSAGYTGSVSFSYYQAKTVYEYDADYIYYSGIGAVPITMGNPNLSWQKKFDSNIGITASLFKNRLNFSADYYKNTTNDLLMPIVLPPSVGVTSMNVNFGKIINQGFDFSVSGQIINNDNLFWSMTLTGGHVMDQIKEISDALKDVYVSDDDDSTMPDLLFTEGGSQFDIYAVRSAGIDPATGQEIFIKKNGDYTYTYDSDDRVVVGNTNPILSGSLLNTIRYKGFSLSITTSYTFGGDYYNTTLQSKVEDIDPYVNVDARAYTDRWKSPGDLVRFLAINSTDETITSERFVEKRNELYFSSVQFTYDFQPAFLNRIGIKKLCVGVGTTDLGYISTVKYERGTSYPYCRTVNLIFRPTF